MEIVWRKHKADNTASRLAKQRVQAMLDGNMCYVNNETYVDPGYVMRAWKSYDLILLMGSVGFLVGYFKKDVVKTGEAFPGKGFYIDVVCSTGHGKALIAAAETLARQHQCQYLELMALPHVLLYYDTLGYKHLYMKRVVKAIPWPHGTKLKAKEICKNMKGHVNVMDLLLKEMPSLLLFFQKLHDLNMGWCKRLYQKEIMDDFKVPVSASDVSRSRCGKDGYLMRKLLK